jgi:nicotinate (nicotinamide) nucleotide adenylyltransferase
MAHIVLLGDSIFDNKTYVGENGKDVVTHLRESLPNDWQATLKATDAEIFFVIGADSWAEINTWREWEKVLTLTNIIVVTRPNYDIGFSHVTEEIRERIVDLRKEELRITNYELRETRDETNNDSQFTIHGSRVYITDAVNLNVSATEIRRKIRAGENNWRELVTPEVAKYIENYELYI